MNQLPKLDTKIKTFFPFLLQVYMKVLTLSYMTVLRSVNNLFTVLYENFLLKGSQTPTQF